MLKGGSHQVLAAVGIEIADIGDRMSAVEKLVLELCDRERLAPQVGLQDIDMIGQKIQDLQALCEALPSMIPDEVIDISGLANVVVLQSVRERILGSEAQNQIEDDFFEDR